MRYLAASQGTPLNLRIRCVSACVRMPGAKCQQGYRGKAACVLELSRRDCFAVRVQLSAAALCNIAIHCEDARRAALVLA